jgi:hypothetical protein
MKTEALIDLLALGAGPAPRALAARRLIPAVGLGLVASGLLALLVFEPVPPGMLATPALWIKLAFAATLAVAAGSLAARLSRPVARLAGPRNALLAVVGAMVALGAMALLNTPAPGRLVALLGGSWVTCPWSVLGLSLPALAMILRALRGLAPTRLKAAGFAAGLLAGAVGAIGYSLSCTEVSPSFVAIWYSLGIAATAAIGAALGPHVLRW